MAALTEIELELIDTADKSTINIILNGLKATRGGQYPADWYDKVLKPKGCNANIEGEALKDLFPDPTPNTFTLCQQAWILTKFSGGYNDRRADIETFEELAGGPAFGQPPDINGEQKSIETQFAEWTNLAETWTPKRFQMSEPQSDDYANEMNITFAYKAAAQNRDQTFINSKHFWLQDDNNNKVQLKLEGKGYYMGAGHWDGDFYARLIAADGSSASRWVPTIQLGRDRTEFGITQFDEIKKICDNWN